MKDLDPARIRRAATVRDEIRRAVGIEGLAVESGR